MMFKALAWDDEPETYLVTLSERLKGHGVSIEITRNVDDFFRRFEEEFWDFVLLDVIDVVSDPENPRFDAGIKLASYVRDRNKTIPIIFVTEEGNTLTRGTPIPGPVLSRGKLGYGDMVVDIMRFVKSYVVNYTSVFLIYGHNRKAGNIKEDVIRRLKEHKLNVESISSEEALSTIMEGLVEKMLPCAGIIAICTPDDRVNDNWYQPRQNVLLEIGIAIGLSKGLGRLTILQRWGSDPVNQAKLPTDLEGKLSIRFYDDTNYQDELDKMLLALKKCGVRIQVS